MLVNTGATPYEHHSLRSHHISYFKNRPQTIYAVALASFTNSGIMGLRSINCMTPQCAPAFCRCYGPPRSGQEANYSPEPSCRCGESDTARLDWTWDPEMSHPETILDCESVVFHPFSSRGTSVVRGNRPLEPNHIHFWEVKVTSFMSGTDLVSKIQDRYFNCSNEYL